MPWACSSVPGRTVRRTAAQPRYPPRRARRGVGRPGPGAARLPVRRRSLMAAGRPHGPNDPSLMSSLETAVTGCAVPGLAELTWNWRWELGILALLAVPSGLIASRIRPSRTRCRRGGRAGGRRSSAAVLAAGPPMVHRPGLVPHHAAPGPGRAARTPGCRPGAASCRSSWRPRPRPTVSRCGSGSARASPAADLHAAKDVLAAACWATEVRVIPSASRAQLVTLEIVRTRHPERGRPTPEAWPSPVTWRAWPGRSRRRRYPALAGGTVPRRTPGKA